jgi:hypothetical protein
MRFVSNTKAVEMMDDTTETKRSGKVKIVDQFCRQILRVHDPSCV